MKKLLPLVVSLVLTGGAFAQVQYSLNVDPALSNNQWSANTSLGNVVGVPDRNFQFDGSLGLSLAAPGAPFGSGQFNGGDMFTIPSTLVGKIPNPIPFTPPIARIEVRSMHTGVSGPSFPIDPATGAFTTDVVMDMLSGEIYVDPWIGSTTITPIAGMQSDVFTVSGTIQENAGQVVLDMPLNLVFPLTGSVTGTLSIVGNIGASATIQSANMVLTAGPLVSGQNATMNVSGAFSNAAAYLVYSVHGLGSTPVPQLGITLDLNGPVLAAGPTTTDGNGVVSWTLPIPGGLSGVPVWLQACQSGATSNVVATTIQ